MSLAIAATVFAVIFTAERNNVGEVGRLNSGNFSNALDQLMIGNTNL